MKVCMIAYSDFDTDARIKNYVNLLNNKGLLVDLIMLSAKRDGVNENEFINYNNNRLFRIYNKYIGDSLILYIMSYMVFFLKAFMKTTKLYFKEEYKVIHVHNMPNFIVFAGLIPKLLGSKIILDIHDLMIPLYVTKFAGKLKKHIFYNLLYFEQKLSSLFVDHIICADHIQKDSLINDYKINPEIISVFMNLPSEDIFKIVKVKRASDNFNLIYHGTISKRLGIDLLLYSIKNVINEIKVKLFIYGSGEYLEDIIKIRHELGMEEDVFINEKFVPAEELSPIICSMDAGIIGNRYSLATNKYMMPVKLIEYVYHHIPVIAPRLDIIMHYFDEEMIKYYDPENIEQMCNCIKDLYYNIEERKSKIKNASMFFKKYNNDILGGEYLNLIGNLCA